MEFISRLLLVAVFLSSLLAKAQIYDKEYIRLDDGGLYSSITWSLGRGAFGAENTVTVHHVYSQSDGTFELNMVNRCPTKPGMIFLGDDGGWFSSTAVMFNGEFFHKTNWNGKGREDDCTVETQDRIPTVGDWTISQNVTVKCKNFVEPELYGRTHRCYYTPPDYNGLYSEPSFSDIWIINDNYNPKADLIVDDVSVVGAEKDSEENFIVKKDSPIDLKVKVRGVDLKGKPSGHVEIKAYYYAGNSDGYASTFINVDDLRNGPVDAIIRLTGIQQSPDYNQVLVEVEHTYPESRYNNNGGFANLTFTGSSKALLEVKDVRFAQVVYNPYFREPLDSDWHDLILKNQTDFSAVKGKSASFEVTVSKSGVTGSPEATYKVQIKDGNKVIMDSGLRSISEVPDNGNFVLTADKMFGSPLPSFIPTHDGVKSFTVEIMTNNQDVEVSKPLGITINSVKTNVPSVGVMKGYSLVAGEMNAVDVKRYGDLIDQGKYLSSILPVVDKGFKLQGYGDFGVEGYKTEYSRAYDYMELEFYRRMLGLNKMVGVVAGDYFPKKFPEPLSIGWVGATPKDPAWRNVMLVDERFPGTVVHEFSHSNSVKYDLYNKKQVVKTDGFDADSSGYFGKRKVLNSVPTYMVEDNNDLRWVDTIYIWYCIQ